MIIDTKYMTELQREINRLGTPARLTTEPTPRGGFTHLIEVGSPWESTAGESYEILICADDSTDGEYATPPLFFGVYDQPQWNNYVDINDPESTPVKLAELVFNFHKVLKLTGVYA